MTSPAYTWPKPGLLSNADFEAVAGTDYTDWTESGTIVDLTGASANGGAGHSPSLAQNAYVYQDLPFVSGTVRWSDQDDDLGLELYMNRVSGNVRAKIQVFLVDGSSVLQFSWDFEGGRWVAMPSTSMDDGESWGLAIGTVSGWTQYKLPKIYAPSEASGDVADDWSIRVRLWNDSNGTASVGFDDAILSQYRGATTVERIGKFSVAYNGVDYPVKYDHRSGTATELSINYPYQTDNSALPTVTANTTGGNITDAYWIGYAHTFLNSNVGEESALPLGAEISSGYFVQQAGTSADTNSNSIDFSAIELPNQENAKTTDSTDVTDHVVYRTREFATQSEAEIALENGELFFDGTVAVSGTFTSGKTNDALIEGALRSGYIDKPTKLPTPFMDTSTAYRSRLFFAGSKHHRLGSVSVVNGNQVVTGINPGVSTAATHLGRWSEWMVFQKDGDGRTYDVERFVYPSDDGGASVEKFHLSEFYAGTTTSGSGYTLRPRSGRVYFTDEGNPHEFDGVSFFTLDGDEGESVVALGSVARNLLAMTRNTTYSFDYQAFPGDLGGIATPISREIGCIAEKSFIEVRGVGYWLSDHGVVRSNGGSVEVIGNSLQDIFTDPDDVDYVERSRRNQMAEAYAGHYPDEQQILMAVRTKNATQGCDVVIVYNYFYDTWDMLRVRAGVTGFHNSVGDDGQPILLFTDGFGQVSKWGEGTVDGAGEVNNRGLIRGKITSSATLSAGLSTADALFDSAHSQDFASATLGLEGSFIKVTSATDGTVQYRRVFDNDGTSVRITKPWGTTPTIGDYWELGGIDHLLRGKNSNMSLTGSVKSLKRFNIYHKEEAEGGIVEVRYYPDFATVDAMTQNDKVVDSFVTGGNSRSQVAAHDTAGYFHRIEFDASGAENPFEAHFFEAVFEEREKDK